MVETKLSIVIVKLFTSKNKDVYQELFPFHPSHAAYTIVILCFPQNVIKIYKKI